VKEKEIEQGMIPRLSQDNSGPKPALFVQFFMTINGAPYFINLSNAKQQTTILRNGDNRSVRKV